MNKNKIKYVKTVSWKAILSTPNWNLVLNLAKVESIVI